MLRLLLAPNLLGEPHRTYMNTMCKELKALTACVTYMSLTALVLSLKARLRVCIQALSLSLSLFAAPGSPTDLA